MANDESTITGTDQLLAKLGTLESLVVQKQVLVDALQDGGPQLIADEAARLAPVDTGKLSRSMMVSVQDRTATSATAKIGPSRPAFYGLFNEFGTIKMAKQAFLQPAFEARREEAIAMVGASLARFIEQAMMGTV